MRGYIEGGKIYRQFSFLIWTSFIGQFVHPVRGEGMGGIFSQRRA